jgi:hypothetical protein
MRAVVISDLAAWPEIFSGTGKVFPPVKKREDLFRRRERLKGGFFKKWNTI